MEMSEIETKKGERETDMHFISKWLSCQSRKHV